MAHTNESIVLNYIASPIGDLLAGISHECVCLLEFADQTRAQAQTQRLEKLLRTQSVMGKHALFKHLTKQLKDYFNGDRQLFDIPLFTPGSPFQQTSWQALQTIPYGTTRSYQQQAQTMGRPTATRAIAKANADNRIAILIPCHRLIAKDGHLTGYGGGIWRKQYLFDLEKQHAG